ncbi:MAG: hypothetical protein KBD93_01420, partial [Streptococcus sp.]|nr:hypothetical protein [Streptococcus sp.]
YFSSKNKNSDDTPARCKRFPNVSILYTNAHMFASVFIKNLKNFFLVQFWATSLSTYIIKESEIFLQLLKDLMNIA